MATDAVTLKKLYCTQMPDVTIDGTEQRTHVATWRAEVDQKTSSDFVLQLARGLFPNSLGDDVDTKFLVPLRGDAMATDDESVVHGILPANVSNWVLAGQGRSADGGAIAKRFHCRQVGDYEYDIIVTYMAPDGGISFDQPKWYTRFGDLTTLPTTTTAGTLVQKLNNANDPLTEPKSVRVDYIPVETYESLGFQLLLLGDLITPRQPIVNPLGEPYPPVPVVRKHRMVKLSAPVSDANLFVGLLESTYGDSLNSTPFTMNGESIPAWHARYDSAEASDDIEQDGFTYQILTWRFEISPIGASPLDSAFVRAIPATATKYLTAEKREITPHDSDGIPTGERVPITKEGLKAGFVRPEAPADVLGPQQLINNGPQHIDYAIYQKRLVDYSGILDWL